jgi:hypothetical protein
MKLWIVGQFRKQTADGNVWDFQGAFDSREAAVAACRSHDYFIAPSELNAEIPDNAQAWPDCEYPIV